MVQVEQHGSYIPVSELNLANKENLIILFQKMMRHYGGGYESGKVYLTPLQQIKTELFSRHTLLGEITFTPIIELSPEEKERREAVLLPSEPSFCPGVIASKVCNKGYKAYVKTDDTGITTYHTSCNRHYIFNYINPSVINHIAQARGWSERILLEAQENTQAISV